MIDSMSNGLLLQRWCIVLLYGDSDFSARVSQAATPRCFIRMMKRIQNLKQEYDAENTAWRQAISEKARKQLAESEKNLKATYQSERDQQIDMVLFSTCQALWGDGMGNVTLSEWAFGIHCFIDAQWCQNVSWLQVLNRLDKENVQTTKALKEQHAAELSALKEEQAAALTQVLSEYGHTANMSKQRGQISPYSTALTTQTTNSVNTVGAG